ncbi:MAG: MFS transporter [Desulfobulbaceae bacterium]|nr:MFS transporter [Desulfobulbaceae bacterium]
MPIYVPTLISSVSLQALLVLLPLYALEKGTGAPFAALLIGLRGVGMLLFDLPAGILLARLGDRPVLLFGLAAMMASTALFAFSGSPWIMGIAAIVAGMGFSAWMIGRQSYITDNCEIGERGRAIAAMAGTMRIGGFIGPAVGAAVAQAFGFAVAFIVLSASVGGALLFVMSFSRKTTPATQPGNAHLSSIKEVASANVRALATGGVASVGLQLMRSSRILLIPLFGHFMGLSIATIGLIISLSAVLDAAMFVPVGIIMDRYGRKWASVPCLLFFAVSLALLPLTQGYYSLLAVSLLAGFANGLGTGSLLTLGSDLAPLRGGKEFLGIWRFIGDIGHAGGPLMIGALINLATLGLAATATAGIGLVSAAVMYWLVDETLRR